jgi:hypothetical protein
MQPDSPYRLIEPLGSSTVGQVWSAVDSAGRRVTVAVLDSLVAGDPQWREAFAAAARARGAAGLALVSSDFSGSAPWAAFAATDDGPGAEEVFRALGVEYTPASEQPAVEQPAVSTTPEPAPTAPAEPAVPAPTPSIENSVPIYVPPAGAPITNSVPIFVPATPVAPVEPRTDPIITDPIRTDAMRTDLPRTDLPRTDPPYLAPPRLDPPPRVDASRHDRPRPDGPRFGRGLAILGAFALAAVLVAGAAVIAIRSLPLGGSTAAPTAPPTSRPAPTATTPPPQPGIEPPIPGNWPRVWVGFVPADNARTLTLEGLRFPLQVPFYWNCSPAGSSPGVTRYNCSGPINDDQDIGGEIEVRECPAPCGAVERDAMRANENGWGLQWRFAGPNATIAESLKLFGQDKTYGLVLLGYFSSQANGRIDRQIALRMSCPADWLGDLRKVAVSIRAGAKL